MVRLPLHAHVCCTIMSTIWTYCNSNCPASFPSCFLSLFCFFLIIRLPKRVDTSFWYYRCVFPTSICKQHSKYPFRKHTCTLQLCRLPNRWEGNVKNLLVLEKKASNMPEWHHEVNKTEAEGTHASIYVAVKLHQLKSPVVAHAHCNNAAKRRGLPLILNEVSFARKLKQLKLSLDGYLNQLTYCLLHPTYLTYRTAERRWRIQIWLLFGSEACDQGKRFCAISHLQR